MLRLALGTACTIATLLCIPDGIAILPKAQNVGVWLIRVAGLWLSCYCLWTFGFLGVLYLVRFVARGVEFDERGFKLWRFGKHVPWASVRAVACEPQPVFSRAFCLPTVHRLTIYCAKTRKDGTFDDSKLTPHNIPSFQFDADDFRSMLVYVSQSCFQLEPSALDLLVSSFEVRAPLKASYEQGRQMRVAMSCIILASLVFYLGRKGVVNYSFNMGLKEYKQEHYAAASEYYSNAVKVDPWFAPAWDQLARCEYRTYKHGAAEAHWKRALEVKPDYVEAKIGLATLHVLKREYGPARVLLKKALQLSPTNIAAYMSMADLLIREGQYIAAIEILEQIVQRDEANSRARGLLTRAYLRSGDLEKAERELGKREKKENDAWSDDAFLNLVSVEVDIARGDLALARDKLDRLNAPFRGHPLPDDLLLDWISLRAAQADHVALTALLTDATKRGIPEDEISAVRRVAVTGGGRR